MEIKGKSVLITGAARRLGKAIALALAGRGAQVVIHYNRSKKEAEKVVEEIEKKGGAARLACGDISKAKACEKIVRDAVKAFGRLDVLVNNAAVFFKTPLFQVTEKEWNEILDANLKGSFFCAQAAAKDRQIALIGEAWWLGAPNMVLYAAIVAVAFHLRVVMYEEPVLRRLFGSAFDAYCARVRRWGVV